MLSHIPRALPVIVFLSLAGGAAGAFVGTQRPTSFEARSVLQVGRFDVASQAIPGYVAASKVLADTYSRIATSATVVRQIAEVARVPTSVVAESLEATPAPETTTFQLIVTHRDPKMIRRLMPAALTTVQRYIRSLSHDSSAERLLKSYRRQLTHYHARLREARRLRREAALLNGVQAERLRLREDSLRVAAAEYDLRAQALSETYASARQVALQRKPVVVIDAGKTLADNRNALVQRFAFAGLLTGLFLGLGVAHVRNVVRERRLRRREELIHLEEAQVSTVGRWSRPTEKH